MPWVWSDYEFWNDIFEHESCNINLNVRPRLSSLHRVWFKPKKNTLHLNGVTVHFGIFENYLQH